ncbi:MAG: DUF4867 family protein [Lachnospiraceae bacterium]|nr:DUF4867 family protein [Lachnospiraceae bacterium]
MGLIIKNVKDPEFCTYGRIVSGYNVSELLDKLVKTSPAPKDSVIYVPSDAGLEETPAMKEFTDNCYGGMPIQIGYCNGTNTRLNCLEYHRDSEIDIAASDCILLLARQQDAANGKILDSSLVEAFFCPAGTAVELYATTLHYAPCSAKAGEAFRVVIILPKGTNYDAPKIDVKNEDDKRLFASNKWLIAHKDAPEAKQGAVIGISGENIDIAGLI